MADLEFQMSFSIFMLTCYHMYINCPLEGYYQINATNKDIMIMNYMFTWEYFDWTFIVFIELLYCQFIALYGVFI